MAEKVIDLSTISDAITIDPEIRHSMPVLTGTRIPIAQIFQEVADGESPDSFARTYGISVPMTRKLFEDFAKYFNEPFLK